MDVATWGVAPISRRSTASSSARSMSQAASAVSENRMLASRKRVHWIFHHAAVGESEGQSSDSSSFFSSAHSLPRTSSRVEGLGCRAQEAVSRAHHPGAHGSCHQPHLPTFNQYLTLLLQLQFGWFAVSKGQHQIVQAMKHDPMQPTLSGQFIHT